MGHKPLLTGAALASVALVVYNMDTQSARSDEREAIVSPSYTGDIEVYEPQRVPTQEEIALARLIYGEASSDSLEGQVACAYSVVNRVNSDISWHGQPLLETIFENNGRTWQYDCFRPGTSNHTRTMNANTQVLEPYIHIAQDVLDGDVADPTNGATAYHTIAMGFPARWNADAVQEIFRSERHIFYVEK